MAGRFNLSNQLRYLQWISVCLMVLIILEKLFALLSVAYGVYSGDPLSEAQAVRDDVFERTITAMVLLWVGTEYLWASYEVFPAFVMHESGVEDGPYAVWGVMFTMLLQLANMAFMAQALGQPITSIKSYSGAAFTPSDMLTRAQNTVGAHLFLILVTLIGFALLLVIEGIIISNRKYWLDQNPPAEPVVYYQNQYIEKPVYVQVPQAPAGQFVNRPPVAGVPQPQFVYRPMQPGQAVPSQVAPQPARPVGAPAPAQQPAAAAVAAQQPAAAAK